FCDFLTHDSITPDCFAAKEASEISKNTTAYCPLCTVLEHRWAGLSRNVAEELSPPPSSQYSVPLWGCQVAHGGALLGDASEAPKLRAIWNALSANAQVNRQAIPAMGRICCNTTDATTAACEILPVCAVVGGMLVQDVLKVLAARDSPIVNFFVFNGSTGGGTVCRMDIPQLFI
ncbi:hypothetical protein OBBRIDRAFT_727842, partial [Obba rivulosa]